MLRLFRARTLQAYVLKEFAVVFALTLLACTLFLLLAFLFQLNNEYAEKGITFGQIVLLFPFFLPKITAFAAPVATMIAATMVFSRLSAEDELIAAQAGGAPLRAMTLPVILSSVLLCGYCLWANQGGISWGFSTIRNNILKVDKPDSFFEALDKPGRSLSVPSDTGGIVRINLLPHEIDKVTNKVRKPIHIAFFQNQQVGTTVLAEDFSFKQVGEVGDRSLRLTLTGGQMLGDNPSYFKEVTMDIHLPSISSLVNFGVSRGQKGWWDNYLDSKKIGETIHRRRQFVLDRAADYAAGAISSWPGEPASPAIIGNGWSGTRIAAEAIYSVGGAYDQQHQHYVECWQKIASSILPFSVSFLGIGLGLLVKKSNRLVGFFIGLLVYALVYYPSTIITRELAGAGRFGIWILWCPNIVIFVLGYALCYAYEHGELTSLPPIFSNTVQAFVSLGTGFWRLISPLQHVGRWLFKRKTDGYMAGSFIVPLLVVVLALAAVYTAFDFFEHGNDTVEGIIKAGEPMPGIPTRTFSEACLDVVVYYGICSLSFVSEILSGIVLIAGLLCIYVLIRNNEHLILKSAGLPLQRAFRPLMMLTLVFSLGVTAIRETIMPSLLMHRDYLKPLVYHRSPAPTAIGMYTIDAEGHPVIFEMSEYSPATRAGKNLRIFLLGKPGERISTIVADRAVWDGNAWRLQTDPTKLQTQKKKPEEIEKVTAGPLASKGAPVALDAELSTVLGEGAHVQLQATDASRHLSYSIAKKPAHGKVELKDNVVQYTPDEKYTGADEIQFVASNGELKSNVARVFVTVFEPVGRYVHPQTPADARTPGEFDALPAPVRFVKPTLATWRGSVTPAYLESERINNKGVMRLGELQAAAAIKPEFAVEWWKRISEAAMGIFLLWVTIPLLLSEESRGPLIGVAWSILIGAAYWGLNLIFSEVACSGWLPTWGPLIPHAAFMLLGSRAYYIRMET